MHLLFTIHFRPQYFNQWFNVPGSTQGFYRSRSQFLIYSKVCFSFSKIACEWDNYQYQTFLRCSRCRLHLFFVCFFWDDHGPMNLPILCFLTFQNIHEKKYYFGGRSKPEPIVRHTDRQVSCKLLKQTFSTIKMNTNLAYVFESRLTSTW